VGNIPAHKNELKTTNNKSTMTKSVTVSAPGKVLLAGGYLVLESPNVGLVIAANKRFYCKVDLSEEKNNGNKCHIVVNSPQFHSVWEYQVEAASDDFMSLMPSDSNKSENSFVEKTLRVTLAYVLKASSTKQLPSSLNITIQADNDFYSVVPHLQERTPEAVESLPKFLPCPQGADGKAIVNKTGLGSSAALVTSVVGALLLSFELDVMANTHNLAQLCHCHAQGKVGSGFDVSSAVFGSHVYRRFPKCTLADLLQDLSAHSTTNISKNTMALIQRAVETKWGGGVVEGIDLPDGLQLLLADVCGGSESPSMARKVLAWKASRDKEDTTSAYWEDLEQINPKIIELLKKANASNGDGDYQELHLAFQESRKALKSMGEAAGVPIEPEAQTALANATQALDGVIAAVVPGAGGYDALACLFVDKGDTKDRIGKLWAGWSVDGTQVCPLAVEAGKTGEGLRVEV
jgi:phosphomevalonate kinase